MIDAFEDVSNNHEAIMEGYNKLFTLKHRGEGAP